MRYHYEFKRKCVEMYRNGQWADTPVGIKESKFKNMLKRWAIIVAANW